jgi:transcriptional regulator GlxA family with amidase domain
VDVGRASWRFGLVLQPGFGLMGLAGVLETLQAANRLLEQPLYDTVLLGRGPAGPSAEGVPVLAHAMGQAGWLDAVLVHAEGPGMASRTRPHPSCCGCASARPRVA